MKFYENFAHLLYKDSQIRSIVQIKKYLQTRIRVKAMYVQIKKNNIYNIDKEFDYSTVKAIVVKSLEKMVKQESSRDTSTISNDILSDIKNGDNNLLAPPTPLLKLKIRNTTRYLNWRLSILKRDNFTCKMCHTSVKENKRLRLGVHHPKAFDDICNESKISTIEQALKCKELWNLSNGVSICYRCHKDVEKLRTKLRNTFH